MKTLSNEIRHELLAQHAALDAALEELVRAASAVDPRPLQTAWATFERGLLRHFALEETSLFPLVESAHHDEVRAFRAEHARLRGMVEELGLSCDLHTVRKSAIDELVKTLHAHAEREDATLYRWVEELAPVDSRRHLLRLIADTVRAELRTEKSANHADSAR